ncbi:hypothetical protein ACFPK9_11870 [Rubritalea spongiae]|uniref:Uncharacterized protein n=1 Tax=Rubritalea spongiae TaxID=430797 RepID=A0ABW5DYF5_9BACT
MLKHALMPSVLVALCSLTPATHAETLSKADREALAEQLDYMINKGKEAMTQRQSAAYQAYRSAMNSDSDALDFYLKCYEKLNFTDKGKSYSDFRNWKSNEKNKERHSESGFRCALRHQLNWLTLTIEAAQLQQKEKPVSELAPKVKAAIDNIYADAETLDGFEDMLKQNVKGTVFAKVYGFGTYTIKDWPNTPLNISDVYEKIIFPSYRENKQADKLRSAWKQRIMYEELMLEHWSQERDTKRIGMKKDMQSPEYLKFIETEKPNLEWEMELDVFEAGDELGAAQRMLAHIKANVGHNNILKWVKQLHELVAPEGEELIISETNEASSSTEPPSNNQPTPTTSETPAASDTTSQQQPKAELTQPVTPTQ